MDEETRMAFDGIHTRLDNQRKDDQRTHQKLFRYTDDLFTQTREQGEILAGAVSRCKIIHGDDPASIKKNGVSNGFVQIRLSFKQVLIMVAILGGSGTVASQLLG